MLRVAWIENPLTPKRSGVWRYNQSVRAVLSQIPDIELTTEGTAGRDLPPIEVQSDGTVKSVYVSERPARYPWVPMWFKYLIKDVLRDNLRKAWHRMLGLGWEDLQFLRPPQMPPAEDQQIVHMTDQYLASGISFIRKRPLVITVHDIIPYIVEREYDLNLYERKFHRFLYQLGLRNLHKATAIIADSQYTKDSLSKVHPRLADRIHVVHLGVDHDRFNIGEIPSSFWEKFEITPKQPFILHISNEAPHKNFRTLLHAFATVHQVRPDVQLIKLGRAHNAEHHQETLDLIKTLNIQDSVRFVTNVDDEDIVHWYRAASMMVMPSLIEGFGLPVLEAMASGTPVVISDTPTLREISGDAVLYAPAMDHDAFAERILHLLNDESLSTAMREKGLAHVKDFTWENTAHQILDIYQQVADAN